MGGVLTGRDMSLLMKLYHENEAGSIGDEEVIGESGAMRQIKRMINKVAKTDVPVFITGESGVGKEVIAQAIWKNSSRDFPYYENAGSGNRDCCLWKL